MSCSDNRPDSRGQRRACRDCAAAVRAYAAVGLRDSLDPVSRHEQADHQVARLAISVATGWSGDEASSISRARWCLGQEAYQGVAVRYRRSERQASLARWRTSGRSSSLGVPPARRWRSGDAPHRSRFRYLDAFTGARRTSASGGRLFATGASSPASPGCCTPGLRSGTGAGVRAGRRP